MKKNLLLIVTVFGFSFVSPQTFAGDIKPDTVYTGIYVTSIHDIDFKQKEYTLDFWLWLKYKNTAFDFLQNLELPQAKNIVKSFSTVDSSGGKIYLLMKLHCVMMDSWKIGHFPFDRQKLRLSIENSQYDSRSLIFAEDSLGKHYDPRFTLTDWNIDSFNVSVGNKIYETGFGDETLTSPRTQYSSFRVNMDLKRDAIGVVLENFSWNVCCFPDCLCLFLYSC